MDKIKDSSWNPIKPATKRNSINVVIGLYNYWTFIIIYRLNSTHLGNNNDLILVSQHSFAKYKCSLNKVKVIFAQKSTELSPIQICITLVYYLFFTGLKIIFKLNEMEEY